MSFSTPEAMSSPGQAPAPPPMFGEQQRAGTKKKGQGMQPTFLGSGSIPDVGQLGNKTLLGGTA